MINAYADVSFCCSAKHTYEQGTRKWQKRGFTCQKRMTNVMDYFSIGTAVQGWPTGWSSVQSNFSVESAKTLTLLWNEVGKQEL